MSKLFLVMFLRGGTQHILAVAVTNVAHKNIHCYTASDRYNTQVQMQETR